MTDWAQRIMPSRPRKLLVYLDQNFISEMAKPGHSGVRPDFRELYSVLHKGFWNEQLVVLRSRFHDLETRLAGALKDGARLATLIWSANGISVRARSLPRCTSFSVRTMAVRSSTTRTLSRKNRTTALDI
jgi:hypothetical protein